jgi:hypothetical protein
LQQSISNFGIDQSIDYSRRERCLVRDPYGLETIIDLRTAAQHANRVVEIYTVSPGN